MHLPQLASFAPRKNAMGKTMLNSDLCCQQVVLALAVALHRCQIVPSVSRKLICLTLTLHEASTVLICFLFFSSSSSFFF
jgi:hypothetical protein